LEDTVAGFQTLEAHGKIRGWGVSNFDVSDIRDLVAIAGGGSFQTNQVLYNLERRGVEWNLMPLLGRLGVPVMAYSPIEQGRLSRHRALAHIARRHAATPAQIALAWLLRHPQVCAIPKAGTVDHVRENLRALAIKLTKKDVAELDEA